MATLKDVAALAHVDVSTVSRALNNTSYVHPETKARVMEAVKELSYHPNVLARGLRKGKLNTIAVIVPKLSFSVFAEVISGVEEEARKRGYATIISNTSNDRKIEKESLNLLRNGFIDGMIIAATGANNRLLRDISQDMPIVQVIRLFDPKLSSVVVDYKDIGYQAVKHLAGKGCKKIGFINGSSTISPYADRYAGYKKAIKELGLEELTAERESRLRGMKYGYDCAIKLIDGNSGLDAIIAATDAQGMGVLRALRENGCRVPQDICVMSLTGHRVGDILETSLTSVELPGLEIGARAADMLIQAIEADEKHKASIQHLTFPTVISERESSDR